MSTGFMKGAAVGVVCALVGGLGSVALAGSGVGAVFNLGKTNSVNAKSSLTGSSATPLLNVVNAHGVGVMGQSKIATQPALEGLNTSGGPGGAFVVNSGVAPFTVSNATKVTNLNADLLDGLDSTALLTHAYAEPTAFQLVPGLTDTFATVTSTTVPAGSYVVMFAANLAGLGLSTTPLVSSTRLRVMSSRPHTASRAQATPSRRFRPRGSCRRLAGRSPCNAPTPPTLPLSTIRAWSRSVSERSVARWQLCGGTHRMRDSPRKTHAGNSTAWRRPPDGATRVAPAPSRRGPRQQCD